MAIVSISQPPAPAKAESPPGSFMDQGVYIVGTGDTRVGPLFSEDEAGFTQASDGPTFLVVGSRASNHALAGLASRFGVELSALREFRNRSAQGGGDE